MSRFLLYGLIALVVVVIGVGVWLYTPDRGRAGLVAQYAGPPSQFLEVAGDDAACARYRAARCAGCDPAAWVRVEFADLGCLGGESGAGSPGHPVRSARVRAERGRMRPGITPMRGPWRCSWG